MSEINYLSSSLTRILGLLTLSILSLVISLFLMFTTYDEEPFGFLVAMIIVVFVYLYVYLSAATIKIQGNTVLVSGIRREERRYKIKEVCIKRSIQQGIYIMKLGENQSVHFLVGMFDALFRSNFEETIREKYQIKICS